MRRIQTIKGMLISLGALLAAASITEMAGTNRMEHISWSI